MPPCPGVRGAVVLCGGGSRRMGRDKAWLPFGPGETMLQRVIRLLREAVPGEHVVVVAGTEQRLPPLPRQTLIVRDRQPGGGPLPAVAQGLAALCGRADMAFAVAGDAPLIRPAFVERVFSELAAARRLEQQSFDVLGAAPRDAVRWHPLAAAYHVGIEPVARQLIQQGATALNQLLDAAPVRAIDVELLRQVDPELVTLRSCNTPEQYESALQQLNA